MEIGGVSSPEIKDLWGFELRDWWVLIIEVNSDFYPTSHFFITSRQLQVRKGATLSLDCFLSYGLSCSVGQA